MKNLFNFERNKILIISTLLICVIISISALVLFEPCSGDMGCMVLIIPYSLGFLALPAFFLTEQLIKFISYSTDSFFMFPSWVKFLPIILLPIYTFSISYFIASFIIKKRSKLDTPEEQTFKQNHTKQKFKSYYYLFVLIAGVWVFVLTPPVPFVFSKTIIKSCDNDRACLQSFFNYKLANCQNQTKFFLYPLKVKIPEADSCAIDSFIKQKPVKDIFLYQYLPNDLGGGSTGNGSVVGTIVSGSADFQDIVAEAQMSPMKKSFDFFAKELNTVSDDKKIAFCDSFNEKEDTRDSNKFYCFSASGVTPETTTVSNDTCLSVLTKIAWTGSSLQNLCIGKLNFKVYWPDESLFNALFGNAWAYPSYNYAKFVQSVDGIFFQSVVYTNMSLQGNSDEIRINEMPVSGVFYEQFKKSLNTPNYILEKDIYGGTDNYVKEVTKVTTVTLNGKTGFIRDITEKRPNSEEILKSYSDFNFFKDHPIQGNTFINISSEYYKGSDRNAVFLKVAESILKQ